MSGSGSKSGHVHGDDLDSSALAMRKLLKARFGAKNRTGPTNTGDSGTHTQTPHSSPIFGKGNQDPSKAESKNPWAREMAAAKVSTTKVPDRAPVASQARPAERTPRRPRQPKQAQWASKGGTIFKVDEGLAER